MLQLQPNSPYLSIYEAFDRCDAPVNIKPQLLSNSPYHSAKTQLKEMLQYSQSDAPVNMKAPAIIEIFLPPSICITRDMLQ